jgi:hypothetical protein
VPYQSTIAIRADLDADGVDHQRVAFVMADGIAVPGWYRLRGMLLVHAHVANLMIAAIQEQDFRRFLQQHESGVGEFERHAPRPALVAGRRIGVMAELYFTEFLHGCRGLRLQNRIPVIADERPVVGDTAFAPLEVDQRSGPRWPEARNQECPGDSTGPINREQAQPVQRWMLQRSRAGRAQGVASVPSAFRS